MHPPSLSTIFTSKPRADDDFRPPLAKCEAPLSLCSERYLKGKHREWYNRDGFDSPSPASSPEMDGTSFGSCVPFHALAPFGVLRAWMFSWFLPDVANCARCADARSSSRRSEVNILINTLTAASRDFWFDGGEKERKGRRRRERQKHSTHTHALYLSLSLRKRAQQHTHTRPRLQFNNSGATFILTNYSQDQF